MLLQLLHLVLVIHQVLDLHLVENIHRVVYMMHMVTVYAVVADPRSRSSESQGSRSSPESKSRVDDRDPKGASNPPELHGEKSLIRDP